jgi:hypothetical protein
MGKSVDSVHWAVDRADLVHHGPAAIAVSPSSSELGLRLLSGRGCRTRGGGGRGKHGGPGFGLTGAQKAAERWHDDDEGSGRGALGAGLLEAWREGEGWGRSGE